MSYNITGESLIPFAKTVAVAHHRLQPASLKAGAQKRAGALQRAQQDIFAPRVSSRSAWQSRWAQTTFLVAAAAQPRALRYSVDMLFGNLNCAPVSSHTLASLGVLGIVVRGVSLALLYGAKCALRDSGAVHTLRAIVRPITVASCVASASFGLTLKATFVALAIIVSLPGTAVYAAWGNHADDGLHLDVAKVSPSCLAEMHREACRKSLQAMAQEKAATVPRQFLQDFKRQTITYRGFFDKADKPLGDNPVAAVANLLELCSDDPRWTNNVAMLTSQQMLNAVSALLLGGGGATYGGRPVHLGLNSAGTVHALERAGFGLVRLHTWVPLSDGLRGAVLGGPEGPQPFVHPQPMGLQVSVDIPRPHEGAASAVLVSKFAWVPLPPASL